MSAPEHWLPVPGYEGLYEVSDMGRVRSLDRWVPYSSGKSQFSRGRLLRPAAYANGYLYVGLCRSGVKQKCTIHRLVLLAFRGPCPTGMEALHGVGGQLDNRLSNLRWGTSSENNLDQRRDGTVVLGERHHAARLTGQVVANCRSRAADGEGIAALAREYRVGRRTMLDAVRGVTWRHVKPEPPETSGRVY